MTAKEPRNTVQHILVIEDKPADQEMIRIYLKESSLKHQLYVSDSLREGLQIIQDNQISLVLLDLSLADSTGFNTLRHYLRESPQVPVIVMTGLNDQKVGLEAVRAGAQDYLIKGDFDARRLIICIRHSLERFRQQSAIRNETEGLKKQQQAMETIKELVVIGDWLMDIVNNSMTWSKEIFRIFEIPQNSFNPTLSDYLDLVHREDKDLVRSFINKAVNEEESGPIEHRILLNNRIIKQLSLRTRMKFDQKTNKVLLQGIVQDITPQEKPDPEPPAEGSKEGPVAGEITDPSQTSSIIQKISYNIRTPLSAVVHLLYLLEQTSLSNRQGQLLQDLKTAIDDLSFTLSNLVNLSLLSNDQITTSQEHFRPLSILESIKRVLLFKADQGQYDIDFFIDPNINFSIVGDSNQLGQLFFCLTELAFLHSQDQHLIQFRCITDQPEGSPENLLVQLEYLGKAPDWPSTEDQPTTQEMMDLIAPAELSQNRDRLLGIAFLRLCQQLAATPRTQVKDGRVIINLKIPVELSDQDEGELKTAPSEPVNILLVEDHPMHQIATKQILVSWSELVDVVVAGNGKESLAKAKQEEFDIVLMDLQMPVMDGMTAATALRQTSSVPIIALSASTSKQEEDRCYEIGINDYLAKPFQPEDLYQRIMIQLRNRNR